MCSPVPQRGNASALPPIACFRASDVLPMYPDSAALRHLEAWDRVRPYSEDQTVTEKARRADAGLDRRANRQYLLPLVAPAEGWVQASVE